VGLGDKWGVAMTLMLVASVRMWEGNSEESVQPAAEAAATFEELGDRRGWLQATGVQARALAALGRVGEVRRLLDEFGLADGLSSDERSAAVMSAAATLVQMGEADEAVGALSSTDMMINIGGDMGRSESRALLGLALLQLGDAVHATQELSQAVDEAMADGPRANALAGLSLALAAAGRPEEAVARSEEALEVPGLTYADIALATLGRGFALSQLGRVEEAEEAFAGGLAQLDATGDRLGQALVRLAAGEALDAPGYQEEGERRLAALGLGAPGWRRVYGLAARPRSSATAR
jgi:tetratricopeptide (TPR) repeat protein